MPLTRRSLVLPPSPPSVRLARSWVAGVLEEIGREDLVDSARLGVTELVTNALIHSDPPLSVRIRGTVAHPRIEVVDSSPVPPQRVPVMVPDDPENLADLDVTTFGRGLAIVAMSSSRWGSDLDVDGRGKSVWFEPGTEIGGGAREGHIFSLQDEVDAGSVDPDEERYEVLLHALPARLYGVWRSYYYELRRELRLLAIASPERYPLAVRASEVMSAADLRRRSTLGFSRLEKAIADGEDSVDLSFEANHSTPAAAVAVRDVLAEIFQEFSEDDLLAVRPHEVLVDLETWFFGEFDRQFRGLEPLPWTGPTELPST